MSSLIQRADTAANAQEDRHGPLPALLFVLTAVSGLVDALSYLQLGGTRRRSAMCLGAAVGALLALNFGTRSVLALTTALLAFNVVRAYRFSTSSEPWTVGT